MLSLQNMAKYALAASVLGCLSISAFGISESLNLTHSQGEDETSHRGSGRIVTQVPQATVSYRGTGRIGNESEYTTVAHRGSGRIDDQSPATNNSAYRGSGRMMPVTLNPFEGV